MRTTFLLSSSLIALLPATATAGSAQFGAGGEWSTLQRIDGAVLSETGSALASAGDLDLDGYDDFFVGAPAFGPFDSGRVTLHSGRDGRVLWSAESNQPDARLGAAVAAVGDVNQDGWPDFAIGAPGQATAANLGQVLVHSGADGSVLLALRGPSEASEYGSVISAAGDVDADGHPDVLVGAPQANRPPNALRSGAAFVYSGRSGALLHRFDGARPDEALGSALAGVGDWDQDGYGDLAVGVPLAGQGGSHAGAVRVFSGRDGSLLLELLGEAAGDRFGSALAAAGNLTPNAVGDLWVGAPEADPNGLSRAGSVSLVAGGGGDLVTRLDGPLAGEGFGSALARLPDVNGDALPDLAVGAPRADQSQGAVYVYSGDGPTVLTRLAGDGAFANLGLAVADAGRVPPGLTTQLLAGAPFATVNGAPNAGYAELIALDPFLFVAPRTISASVGGGVSLMMNFPDDWGARPYRVLASFDQGVTDILGLLVPLADDPLFRSTLAGQHPPGFFGASGTLDANGDGGAAFLANPGQLSAFVGLTFYAAAISWNGPTLQEGLSSVAQAVLILP